MIQKIKLTPSQVMTKDNIQKALEKARAGYDYCRIDMKFSRYILIAFFKDNTFDVMTNVYQPMLFNEIRNVRMSHGLTMLTNYIFRWIQVYNR